MGDWDRLVESCKIATGREVNDHWEVMEVVDELHNKVLELESELGRLHQNIIKCHHYHYEWKSDGQGGNLKYCNDCKSYV